MPKHLTTCNEQHIEEYLNGSLDDDSAVALMDHLHSCLQCRERMESAAADRTTWSDAEKFLREDDYYSYESQPAISWRSEFEEAVFVQRTECSVEISQVLNQLNPTDDPQMLGRLGGYEVSGVVGSGGMGIVLKALDRPLDRSVAIKVLAPRLASSGAARLRFAREAKAAATVLHPNVIVIHSVSNEGAMPFLVMPYLRGESLQRRLDRQGPLPTEDILRIAQQVASGLAAAHGQGLVHRDIKPANIMLEDGVERVTLTDFGLARAVDDASMTRSGVVAGTPQYMSPEQARGDDLDARSDLFSLGSVIYAMCTGRPPFRAESSYGTLRRITDTEPRSIREVNPSIPEWLERIVQRLHAKPMEDRIPTAEQVSTVLQKCLAHLQQPTVLELPEECRVPIDRWKFWPISHRIVRTMAIITISCISIAGVSYVGKSLFRNPDPTASRAAPPSPGTTGAKDSSALSRWDSIQADIDLLKEDIDCSEADGRRLWLRKPTVKPQ
jgi:serine/threonine protein kinase